ncbi:unnamed protein product, partial [Arabidopsis halleri]
FIHLIKILTQNLTHINCNIYSTIQNHTTFNSNTKLTIKNTILNTTIKSSFQINNIDLEI